MIKLQLTNPSAIVFLVTSVCEKGSATGYFVFYPKVHIICLLLLLITRSGMEAPGHGSGAISMSGTLVRGQMVQLTLSLRAIRCTSADVQGACECAAAGPGHASARGSALW